MAEPKQNRLTPDAAGELLDAIRAKNASAVRWALIHFDKDRERFLNTPIAEQGGARTLFLLEAMKTGDETMVRLMLEGGAKPETRTQGDSGLNAFHSEKLDVKVAGLLLSAMRNRMPGREIDMAIHNAIVGEKGQTTDSCLFGLADRRNLDTVSYLLNQLPNDSSRRQALEQCVSPIGYQFDKVAPGAVGYYFHPGKSASLSTVVEVMERDRGGYRSSQGQRIQTMYSQVRNAADSRYYEAPAYISTWVGLQQRQQLEKSMQAQQKTGVTADELRSWLEAEEPAAMPPPLAQRFLAVLPGLSGGGGLTGLFNNASGGIKQLQDLVESFGDDTPGIINSPIVKSDGSRTMLLTEIVNSGSKPALDLLLKAGADPARRTEGGSGPNAFCAEKLDAAQIYALVNAVRAKYKDTTEADKAVHDAILGAKGQPVISAPALQLDGGNFAAAKQLYEALPNDTSRRHAIENAFSPMGLKVDKEARAGNIYLSVDKCFTLQDIAEFRYEKLGKRTGNEGAAYSYFVAAASNASRAATSDSAFYYPESRVYNYMVDSYTRDKDEKRFIELRDKEVAQQKAYRDSLKTAVAERDDAEQALKREQQAFAEQERRLKAVAAEITQLQEQVQRNDTVLEKLAEERGKLRNKLKQIEQSI